LGNGRIIDPNLPGLTDEVSVPADINKGLSTPTPDFLTGLLGLPRDNFTQECRPVTNKILVGLIKTKSVGPFRVQGLEPAVDSLKKIMLEVTRECPKVYEKLGSAGMLCCRAQRPGKKTGGKAGMKISSHSWGTAIDLKLDGKLDVRGNKKVQYGLTLIAPIFNRHGWVWGASFRTEDAMHFEVSREKLEEWQKAGLLGAGQAKNGISLKIGARGPDVRRIQELLRQQGFMLEADGIFGRKTEAALKGFQQKKGLTPSGVADSETWKLLGGNHP
jgi:hypothetical protein